MLYPIDMAAHRLGMERDALTAELMTDLSHGLTLWHGPHKVYYQTLPPRIAEALIDRNVPSTLAPAQVPIAMNRLDLLIGYHKYCGPHKDRSTVWDAYIKTLPPPLPQTYGNGTYPCYRHAVLMWDNYISEGMAALACKRPVKQSGHVITEDVATLMLSVMYNPDPSLRRPDISTAELQRYIAAIYPAARLPTPSTINRWRRKWLEENAAVALRLTNPDKARGKHIMKIGKISTQRPLQRVELDGTIANVICSDNKRYSIIAAIDVHTRRVIALVVPTATAAEQNLLTRKILIDWGVPEEVYIDNGKDYVAEESRSVWQSVGTKVTVLPPFRPDLKPFIESFFAKLSKICQRWPGWVGASVADRKAIESRIAFSTRLGGGAAVKTTWTAAELQQHLTAWLDNEYHEEPHSALGMSPLDKAADYTGIIKRIDNLRALDILLQPVVGTRMYTSVGIKCQGAVYAPTTPEAMPAPGSKVQVRLSDDAGRIYIYDAQSGVYLTDAVDEAHLGQDRRELAGRIRQAAAAKITAGTKALRRQVAAAAKKDIGEELAAAALARKAAAEKARADKLAARKIVPIRTSAPAATPALDQAAKAAQATQPTPPPALSLANDPRLAFALPASLPARMAAWDEIDALIKDGVALCNAALVFYANFQRSPYFTAESKRRVV
jgi:transposase InsO family protein